MLVIADLLGVPEEDHESSAAGSDGDRRPRVGSTGDDTLQHNPLEFLYERFTRYIEDRRREPRDDVLTGLATATFPDGSMPEVIDVVRVAANLFAAGQETTVRLLERRAADPRASAPTSSSCCADERDRIPNFVEEIAADREPGQGRLPAVAGTDHRRRRRHSGRHHCDGAQRRREPRPAPFRRARRPRRRHVRTPAVTSLLAEASTRAPVRRWLGPRHGSASSVSSTAPPTSGSPRTSMAPPSDRRYQYVPTFILRGLTELHLEFTR